jgi:integrase
MAKKVRKEKYITVQTKGKGTYVTVRFSYKFSEETKTYSKTFNAADYPTLSECMNAACRHRDIKRAELASAGFQEGVELTVNEVCEIYVANKHMPASTRRVFYTNYNNYIFPRFGDRSIVNVTAVEIEESLNAMRRERSDEVIGRVFGIWKSIYATARKLRAVKYNVTEEVTVPASRYFPEERTVKEVSDDTIEEALKALQAPSDRESTRFNHSLLAYMIVLCRQTGLRPAEAFALKRSNVNLDDHVILINCQYGSDENGRAIVTVKNKTSVRQIPLTVTAELALRGAMAMSANELIFTKWEGDLFTSNYISCTLSYLGVRNFSIYSLRHQFSTDMITSNVDPRTVMELMGHTNTDMSIGTYARSNDQKKRDALAEIGRKS